MRTKSWMFGGIAALATACGGADTGGVDAQVQAYEAARSELAVAVATYQADAATAETADACRAAEARYASAAGPAMERMRQMGGEMAGEGQHMGGMDGMGRMGGGDLACGAEAMATELARHQGVACAGDTLTNRAESDWHTCQMGGWLEQQRQRCRAMQGDGAEPGACLANPDGTYGMGPCAEGAECPYACDGTGPLAGAPATAP